MHIRLRRPRWRHIGPFWSAVILLVLAMAIVGARCALDRKERFDAAEREVELLAHVFAEHAERALSGVDLTVVAARESVQTLRADDAHDRATAKLNLQRLALAVPQVRLLLWLGPDGRTIADSTNTVNDLRFDDRSFFLHHLTNDDPKPFLSEPVLGRRTGKLTINWSRRIDAPDGTFAGVIVAGLEPAFFQTFYNAVHRDPDDWIGMYRLDGTTLVRFPQTDFVGINRGSSRLITELVPQASSGTQRNYTGATQVPRILSYRVSANFPIVITASRPHATVETPWLRRTAFIAVVTLLIGGLVLVCVRQLELRRRAVAIHAREADANAAARARFVAVMSHEIRTPLNGLLGFAELLIDGDLKPQEKRWATTIRDAGLLLHNIVNDALDLAKIEAGRLDLNDAPFELRAVLRATLALLRPVASNAQLALHLDVDPTVPGWVSGDDARLRQILLNLLGNAIKFTAVGAVELRCRRTAVAGRLRFEITDTGPGLTRAQIDALFTPFVQLDDTPSQRRAGTGLGLAISKELVEKMDGTIGVDSEPGTGSTFWFEVHLPAAAPSMPAVEAAAPVVLQRRTKSRSLTILVADDVATNQHLLRALLQRDGHFVQIVADGRAALAAAAERAFDLILMDVEMPVMDGLEAARAIRDGGGPSAASAIVAVTANVLPEQIAACRAAGMEAYLAKPIDRGALRALLLQHAGLGVPAAEAKREQPSSQTGRVLAELRGSIGVDSTRELVALSLAHLEQLCGKLDMLANDPASARAEAHAVTSIAGNVGLSELVAASRDVCQQLRAQDVLPQATWSRFDRAVKAGIAELTEAAA